MTRIQVSDQGLMGTLVFSIDGHMKKTSGSLVDLKGAVCTRISLEYYCALALAGI